jgi:hypothetical protein
MINIRPKVSVVQSRLNKMLVIDENDPTSIVVNTVIV